MRKHFLLPVLLAWCALIPIGGCTHVAATAGVPARNATPVEKALAYNDSLAQANKAVAQLVVNASGTTPPLLSQDQANKILTAQSRIADFDRQLTPLLTATHNVTGNADRIELLLDEIKAAANPLIKSGELGIKDPATQQRVMAAFSNVYSFADLVVNSLKDAGLLK